MTACSNTGSRTPAPGQCQRPRASATCSSPRSRTSRVTSRRASANRTGSWPCAAGRPAAGEPRRSTPSCPTARSLTGQSVIAPRPRPSAVSGSTPTDVRASEEAIGGHRRVAVSWCSVPGSLYTSPLPSWWCPGSAMGPATARAPAGLRRERRDAARRDRGSTTLSEHIAGAQRARRRRHHRRRRGQRRPWRSRSPRPDPSAPSLIDVPAEQQPAPSLVPAPASSTARMRTATILIGSPSRLVLLVSSTGARLAEEATVKLRELVSSPATA